MKQSSPVELVETKNNAATDNSRGADRFRLGTL